MDSTKTILVCGTKRFPNGDAGAKYYVNIAKCFSDARDKVIFVGNSETDYGKAVKIEGIDFEFISFRSAKKSRFSKLISHLLIKNRIIKYVCKSDKDIDYIILDGSFSLKQYNAICDYYKKHSPNTKIIISIVERYTSDQFDNNVFVRRMIRNNHDFIEKFHNKDCYIIAISSYLENIFLKKEFKCMRVPFIFEAANMITPENKKEYTFESKKIRYIYAGFPSNKDLLVSIIEGISLLSDPELKRIEVNIAGVSKKWLLKNGLDEDVLSKLSDSLQIHGHISPSCVEELYKISDYSLLVRDDSKIFAKAGFPTKVSESMYYCTVPITNLTSDLHLYLQDEVNSFVVKGFSPEDVKKAIKRSIEKYDMIEKLRNNVYKTMKEELSVEVYKNILLQFINE